MKCLGETSAQAELMWPSGVVVSALASQTRDVRFDSRPG